MLSQKKKKKEKKKNNLWPMHTIPRVHTLIQVGLPLSILLEVVVSVLFFLLIKINKI